MTKQRLPYIDIAKGILILLMIWYHTSPAIDRNIEGCNPMIGGIGYNTRIWFECFFMPAFFIINGNCSRFAEDRKTFYIKLLKTIVLPTCAFRFLLPLIFDLSFNPLRLIGFFKPQSGQWFMTALVVARVLVYEAKHIIHNKWTLGAAFLLLTIFATIGKEISAIPNWYYWPQGLCAALFIWIGHVLRDYEITNKSLAIGSLVYLLAIVGVNLCGIHRPVMVVSLAVNWYEVPLFMLLSVTGTALIVYISKQLKSRMLEYIGRNSLVMYFVQWSALVWLAKHLSQYIDVATESGCFVMAVTIYILSIVISLVFVKLTDTKYGRYLTGKF